MEVSNKPNRIHPLMATAAGSVILVSLTGVAAITGLLPSSHSSNPPAKANVASAAPVAGAPDLKSGESAPQEKPAAMQDKSAAQASVPKPAPSYKQSSAQTKYHAPVAQASQVCQSCGRIESIQTIQHQGQPSGVGMVAGAVLGGVLGNQVGGGNGKTLATVAGAVGGGYAGNEIEKHGRGSTTYQVRVRMDNGSVRTFTQGGQAGWEVGTRVKVVNGKISALS